MSAPGKSALVLGGTGQAPSHAARELSWACARKARPTKVDFDQADSGINVWQDTFREGKFDVVFIAWNTRKRFEKVDKDYVLNAARAAKTSDASQRQRLVYVSSGMANKDAYLSYSRCKAATEQGLADLRYADTIVFRPVFLRNTNRLVFQPVEAIAGSAPPAATEDEHMRSLNEAIIEARAPLQYTPEGPLGFNGAITGTDAPSERFNAAALLLVTVLEKGYHSPQEPTPLNPTDWASLSCALLAAIGRGYSLHYSQNQDTLEKVRAEVTDPKPLGPKYPSLFHRLAATNEHLGTHLSTDHETYEVWYSELKRSFNEKAAKAAAAEVEETWRQWKADQIDRRAAAQEAEISAAARSRNTNYFLTAAAEIGLHHTAPHPPEGLCTMPTIGRKRTVSGSTPGAGPSTPSSSRTRTPQITRKAPSPLSTPRGRTTSIPPARIITRADPSPTPQPRKTTPSAQAILSLSPKVTLNLGPAKETPQPNPPTEQTDLSTITAAIRAALAPFTARIEALE
ncbi:hypothetical protein BJV78DRAFT_1285261 [Lactifluus subvellereus]|nr:hypothetical protein BJV78DRAFT_1285261 [Lactifluus subvellereus]